MKKYIHEDGCGVKASEPCTCEVLKPRDAEDVAEYHDMFCEHNDGPYWDATPWPCNCEARRELLNDGGDDRES